MKEKVSATSYVMLSRTYNIDVSRILNKRRGQYDLEDEFLWFYEYIVAQGEERGDRRWKCRSSRPEQLVTLSDDPNFSLISLDCPNIRLLNEKQNFVEICGDEDWVPESIVIELSSRCSPLPLLSPSSVEGIREMEKQGYDLLFLKKAGPGIGGGFDVDVIVRRDTQRSLQCRIEELIEKQNRNPRYRRNVFILQAGVDNPLLTPLGQKIDLRLYMLIVGDSRERTAFYACRVGDIRNTAAYPYDPLSEDAGLQITNISQNRNSVSHLSAITCIFSRESSSSSLIISREAYDVIFAHFLRIVERIAVLYGPLLKSQRRSRRPFVTLIGLDAVVTRDTLQPMIVELNRRPTVYTPSEAREMHYSSALFMHDVFHLGVEALVDGDVPRIPSRDSSFVLVVRQ